MHRFFISSDDLKDEEIHLPEDILHHLSVLRLREGEEILLLDGAGEHCRCRITSLQRKRGTVRVTGRWREKENSFPITLLQGIPKGDKMDLVLQKGTELGVCRFLPVVTGRSIASAEGRRGRWERIVSEAARQCRRPLLPEILPPQPLSSALLACSEELRLMVWEEESRPLAACLPGRPPRDAVILVGPEGGFSAAEAELARKAGFVPAGLGPRILRSETAGFAVASILQFLYGDLGAVRGDDPQFATAPPKEIP